MIADVRYALACRRGTQEERLRLEEDVSDSRRQAKAYRTLR